MLGESGVYGNDSERVFNCLSQNIGQSKAESSSSLNHLEFIDGFH